MTWLVSQYTCDLRWNMKHTDQVMVYFHPLPTLHFTTLSFRCTSSASCRAWRSCRSTTLPRGASTSAATTARSTRTWWSTTRGWRTRAGRRGCYNSLGCSTTCSANTRFVWQNTCTYTVTTLGILWNVWPRWKSCSSSNEPNHYYLLVITIINQDVKILS